MPTVPPTTPEPSSEAGFSLLEIIIVLCIIAVLLPIGLLSLRGARNNGNSLQTNAIAQHYADSIDRFAREHSGRYPKPVGSEEWAGGAQASKGPMALVLGTRRYYLRSTPESVQSGSVVVGATSSTKPSITYAASGNGDSYELTVAIPGVTPCVVRGGARSLTTLKACSIR